MLIALITIFLLGGGSSTFLDFVADSQDAVKTVMVKGDRQKEALAVLKEMKESTNAHDKQNRKLKKAIGEAIEDREDGTGNLAIIFDQHYENLGQYTSDILDLRFELRELLTQEEWEQIFPAE
jgi:RNA binding exosome subunit